MIAAGYAADDPRQTLVGAIRSHDSSHALCSALMGPYRQAALTALAWSFPQWRPAFQLLVGAAQLYCQERDRTAAFWTAAIVGIAGVLLVALSGGKARPA